MTDQMPRKGGSYSRNPKSGKLTRKSGTKPALAPAAAQSAPETEAPDQGQKKEG